MELEDRVAVVTGGSTGIGRATAAELAAAGARVAICARTEPDLEEAADAIRSAGGDVLTVPADVSREEDVRRLARRVREELGPADVLVNNAGVGVFGSLEELDVEDFDRCFDVNVRGVFLCAKAFAPAMAERGDGVVVNVASLAGKNFFPKGSVYAGSKHAVMGLSKSLMVELRDRGVRVLTVCPGSVDTPFFDKADGMDPDREKIVAPEDVAELVVEAVRLSDRGTVSEIEIRPVNP